MVNLKFLDKFLSRFFLQYNKTKTKAYEVSPKRLADPKGGETMKLGAIHYLKQLGFIQNDIGTMIDMDRANVQNALERTVETGSPLKRENTGRPTNLDDYTSRYLERIIRKDLFQTNEELSEQLRLMNQPHSISTVKQCLKELGFKDSVPAVNPLLGPKNASVGHMINGRESFGPKQQRHQFEKNDHSL